MNYSHTKGKRRSLLLPLYGCFLFVVCYVLAALYYPGGSSVDSGRKGFDWVHNYWCNLLAAKSINGSVNSGRPFAFAGMLILVLSLSIFWIQSAHDSMSANWKRTVSVCGVGSIVVSFFLFTQWHDAVINIAGMLGLVALAGLLISLYRAGWFLLFTLGWINLFLIALNNILYYGQYFQYLPVVQKISFLSFLLWFSMISVKRWLREVRQ